MADKAPAEIVVPGLTCPYCGEKSGSFVFATRKKSDSITRTRKCCRCGLPFCTTERVIEEEPETIK